jgi:hypothetical protein
LSGQQLDAVRIVVRTGNQREAARGVGVSEHAIREWTKLPAWKAHVERMSRTGVEAAIEKLRESVSGAVDVLVEVMNDDEASPADRTRAATAILDRVREIGTHVHQHVDNAPPDVDIERELTDIAERARVRALAG